MWSSMLSDQEAAPTQAPSSGMADIPTVRILLSRPPSMVASNTAPPLASSNTN
eukprot:CAMPEP_0172771160 /NCGR_PEP_ID=MMETSP1074-20121228/190101_1 /TAXON_ID=2916 /ORGANISM="Ceratium fusus, Strain PA161109" /LENGTH=52 /DNA_ID=CAMNT_0013607049 /DNA_START=207 /DNA_END=365 /DNA_ORIENTATION=-